MVLRPVSAALLRNGTCLGVNNVRALFTTAFLSRRTPPLGPLPNEDVDISNLPSLEKYRTYNRYITHAERANNKEVWWKTYRGYVEQADPEHGAERVDVGLPCHQPSRTKEVRERGKVMKANKQDVDLERACRLRTFKIPLDRVQESWESSCGPYHIKKLADHYGVFRDLFPQAFFLPQIPLQIHYSQEPSSQVHYGNTLTPTEAALPPLVSFKAEEGSLWTLLLTCPDEHLQNNDLEYVHWLVGNIPGGAVCSGEELCHYLPPFPARGTGFQRYIYVLFKQDRTINYQEETRTLPCHSLMDRTFKTAEFYRKHQDHMTPAGLAFFQSQWDESVTKTFHDTLDMREPVFEFIRPPVYHPPQVKFPHKKPLRYLDRYRDGKAHTYGIY
ncbi:39S ribosomal protein L38, mitochondrial [Synchiropus splendidus]|uniref:39S ribosomal protein L38, mitochondrial n=1 Tax=Synchiropus splendidus TaxID=270530 RepID=UPI00237D4E7F|nr:39S ribosomal protein L38, mitochondrial [Synchiropus splendidus]